MSRMQSDNQDTHERWVLWLWGIATVSLCVYAVWHIGGFDLTTELPSGQTIPNSYATVDHPFHASRAAALLDSLRHGEILRWFGAHQGGYPAEFYPLGIAWFDVGMWALLLGTTPILAVHKLTVALIFVLPALGYWLLIRGDRLHPSIAFLATAFHIALPGYWLSGGYEELVGWGLVTNVAGATFAMIATILLARFVLYRQHACGGLAVLAIVAATVSNPRSLYAIVLATIAIGLWSLIMRRGIPWKHRLIDTGIALGLVGGLSFLLVAPLVLSLIRYNALYFFLHYQFYNPISQYLDAMRMAMSQPLLLLSLVGAVGMLIVGGRMRLAISQALIGTTFVYTAFTVWLASGTRQLPLLEQLEAPRLMPYQRLIMLAIAAVSVILGIQLLTRALSPRWRELILIVVVVAISVMSFRTMIHREDPLNEQAMYPVSTTGDERFADLTDAVNVANRIRPEGTAVFVIGNVHEWWHEQLWSPGIEYGTYYYDDWMWYWHRDQIGPYQPTNGYYMDNPTQALTMDYLREHGIGVVMVSDMWVPNGIAPRSAARESDLLSLQGTYGGWDVYTVVKPTSVATRGTQLPQRIDWSNQRIQIEFDGGDGPVLVRQNWFPRWQAVANGERADITRTESGYMLVEVPDGSVALTLSYAVTSMDWIARVLCGVGGVGFIAFITRGERLRYPLLVEESDYVA